MARPIPKAPARDHLPDKHGQSRVPKTLLDLTQRKSRARDTILLSQQFPERAGCLHTYWQRNYLCSLCGCLLDKATGSSEIIWLDWRNLKLDEGQAESWGWRENRCQEIGLLNQSSSSQPKGNFASPDIWQCLETFLIVTSGGCYWHLLGRVQRPC